MFDHIQIKVRDFKKSRRFYKSVLAPLGYKVVFEARGVVMGFGTSPHDMFEVRQAGRGAPLSRAVHIALRTKSKKAIDAFYKAALAHGGKDNGQPGLRPEYEPGYYAAFVLDPDGHNLEAVYKK